MSPAVLLLAALAAFGASAWLALALAAPGQAATGHKRGSHRVVVSPRPGQRIKHHPVRIAVRADNRLRDLSVRLNGHRIGAEFGPRRKGVRVAVVGASHGLRHGLNVLRVRARQPNRRWRRATVRFRVVHRLPLAGAGYDRRVHVRQRIKLNGLASSTGPSRRGARAAGARRGRRGHLRYRWRLIASPKRSRLGHRSRHRHGPRRAAASQAAGQSPWAPRLAGLESPQPSFTPDVPGTYVFELTVGDGSYSSSDKVEVEATPRSWLVPIRTMAQRDGKHGILVGNAFYPGDGPGDDSRCVVQLLVLDRSTLGEAVNRTFGYPGCNADPSPDGAPASRVAAYLKTLNDAKLVIAVSQPGFAAPQLLGQALARIGVRSGNSFGAPHEGSGRVDPGSGGRISAIGVPGLAAGEAQVRTLYDGDQPDFASLDGYLTPDQYLNFKWLPAHRIPFDTRAGSPGDGSPTGPGNTIEVGTDKYTAKLPEGTGGYQVLILDRGTLQPRVPQKTFVVSASQSADASYQALKAMHDYINAGARKNDLLFVSSLGSPSAHVESWAVAPALSDLAGLIGWDGGSRNDFIFALRNHLPYTLVGRGAAGQLSGEETVGPNGGNRLRGALMTDRTSVFAPRDTSSLSEPSDPLLDAVLKPPSTEWPLDGQPEAKAAFSYLGTQTKPALGPDPRSAYVNPLDWSSIIGQVRAMTYPGPGHGFCASVPAGQDCKPFDEAQHELVEELLEVDNVRTYIANITRPFAENGLSSWASLQSIANQIQRAAEVPPNETVLTLVLDVAGGILDVIPLAIPEAKVVQRVISEVIAITYATAIEFWSQNREGGSEDEVRATADKLGLEMAERFKDAIVDIEHMGNVIVTDPAKLKEVGTNANCNPFNNDQCKPEWAWTDDVKTTASAALQRGTEAGFYQELLPLAFPSYRLDPNPGQSIAQGSNTVRWSAPSGVDKFYCGDFFPNHPFANAGAYGSIVVNFGVNIPQSRSRSVQSFEPFVAYAIGAKAHVDAGHPSPAPAPPSVLKRMFSPVDPGNNPRLGGLGIDRADYMQRTQTTYGPKDPFGSNCGWEH